MKKIYSGQSFLYRANGYNSTVFEARMTQRIRGDSLETAVRNTAKRFPDMTQKLVEKDGSYYLHPDSVSLNAVPTKRLRTLGSMETGYHLIDVTFTGNIIRVAFHHALCDGMGAKDFLQTLLYYYCTERYQRQFNNEGIHTLDEVIDPREFQEPLPSQPYQVDRDAIKPMTTDGFQLPESTPGAVECCRTEITVDQKEFVTLSKNHGATPAIMAAMLFSRSVLRQFPEADKPILCNMAADMRFAIDGAITRRNCTGSFYLPYSKDDEASGMAQVAANHRRLIAEQRSEDAAHQSVNNQIGLFTKLESMPSLEAKRQMMSMFDHLLLNTYVLSYVGRMRFNDFGRFVKSVHMYSGGIKGLTINMVAAGDSMTFDVLQGFEGERYVQGFVRELQEQGLGCRVGDTLPCETGADRSHVTARRQAERWYAVAQ
ncbi:MAG: hypothetical protein ABF747_01125 [Bifidobacterium sp.]|uniref:Alcohol acetyltransferase n=1 Tax=Bifidobacterium fermentum TaxID=3059035 RepID=A0AB39UAG8_9BIFI